MKIAFIGTGNLLEALLAGAIRGGIPREWLMCSTHTTERAYELGMRYGVDCAASNPIVAEDAHLAIVGVRPDETVEVLREIRDSLRPGAVVASASAGTELADVVAELPDDVAGCRIMPSVAARAGHGICGVTFDARATDDQRDLVRTFLGSMGEVHELPEDKLGGLGGLAGSGPAYLAKLAEAMVKGGVELGIDEAEARRLVLETMRGTAALLDPAEEGTTARTLSFDDVADSVGHKGGSTIRSLDHLRATGALDAVQAAVSHSFED